MAVVIYYFGCSFPTTDKRPCLDDQQWELTGSRKLSFDFDFELELKLNLSKNENKLDSRGLKNTLPSNENNITFSAMKIRLNILKFKWMTHTNSLEKSNDIALILR